MICHLVLGLLISLDAPSSFLQNDPVSGACATLFQPADEPSPPPWVAPRPLPGDVAERGALTGSLPGAPCVHEIAPGFLEGVSRAAPSFAEADAQDDGFAWGECPPVEPEPRGRHLTGAISPDDRPRETHAVRRALKASRQQGPGPVLGLLSDCLILGRPPP